MHFLRPHIYIDVSLATYLSFHYLYTYVYIFIYTANLGLAIAVSALGREQIRFKKTKKRATMEYWGSRREHEGALWGSVGAQQLMHNKSDYITIGEIS